MNKKINVFLFIGLLATFTIGVSFITDLYKAFLGEKNIWWTSQSMSLPIEETRNNFELYIGGEPLEKHLSAGHLSCVDNNGKQYSVVSKDISVRLNNWDKVKASILSYTIISSFGFGVAVTLVIIGIIQFFLRRKSLSKGGYR